MEKSEKQLNRFFKKMRVLLAKSKAKLKRARASRKPNIYLLVGVGGDVVCAGDDDLKHRASVRLQHVNL